jgi:hypothetical protein
VPAHALAAPQHFPGEGRVVDDLGNPLIALQAEVAVRKPPPRRRRGHAAHRWHARVFVLLEAVEDVLHRLRRHVHEGAVAGVQAVRMHDAVEELEAAQEHADRAGCVPGELNLLEAAPMLAHSAAQPLHQVVGNGQSHQVG